MNYGDSRRRSAFLAAIVVLALSLPACTRQGATVTIQWVPVRRVPAPAGAYYAVAWLADDRLAVNYESDPNFLKSTQRLWMLQPDGSGMRMLDLPVDSQRCRRTEFSLSQSLPDGRLVFLRACRKYDDSQGYHPDDRRVMVWSPNDNTSTLVRTYELPAGMVVFTLRHDLAHGLLTTDNGILGELFWLDEDAIRGLDLGMVRAGSPAWSPDGQSIAFFGNPRLPGRPGPAWAGEPYDLCLMPADCETRSGDCGRASHLLVRGILGQTAVNWSPDGRWLAFDGDPHSLGPGIWLRHMDTGDLIHLAAGEYRAPTWSADGKRLVVIGPPVGVTGIDPLEHSSALYILDVSEVVEPGSSPCVDAGCQSALGSDRAGLLFRSDNVEDDD